MYGNYSIPVQLESDIGKISLICPAPNMSHPKRLFAYLYGQVGIISKLNDAQKGPKLFSFPLNPAPLKRLQKCIFGITDYY